MTAERGMTGRFQIDARAVTWSVSSPTSAASSVQFSPNTENSDFLVIVRNVHLEFLARCFNSGTGHNGFIQPAFRCSRPSLDHLAPLDAILIFRFRIPDFEAELVLLRV